MAESQGLDYLGALPLPAVHSRAGRRRPSTVAAEPDSEVAHIYKSIARTVAVKVAQRAGDFSNKFPTITVSKNT